MNSIVEDIKDMLLAENDNPANTLQFVFGGNEGNLFLYREPAEPNNVVTLFEAPGMPPVGILSDNSGKLYERPSLQVRIRHMDTQTGYTWAYDILNALHARNHEVWGDYMYCVIYALSNPTMIDFDASGRARIVLNLNVQRKLV